MKQRLLATFLSLCLLVGLLPTVALAADPNPPTELYVGDTKITETGWYTSSDNGVSWAKQEEKPEDNYVHYNTDTGELTLHNAAIQATANTKPYHNQVAAVSVKDGELKMVLEGTNSIQGTTSGFGIYFITENNNVELSAMTIDGDGTLSIEGKRGINFGVLGYDSYAKNAELTINSGNVSLKTTENSGYGIFVLSNTTSALHMNGGSLSISAAEGTTSNYGIQLTTVTSSGSEISARLVMTGGTIDIRGASTAGVALTSNAAVSGNSLTLSGSSRLETSECATGIQGLYLNTSIADEAELVAEGTTCAFRFLPKGSVTMTGGTLVASAATAVSRNPTFDLDGYTNYKWRNASDGEFIYGGFNFSEVSSYLEIAKGETYTLSYDANGGTGAPDAQTDIAHGNRATISDTAPTHVEEEGVPVVFLGWSETKTGQIYGAGEEYPEAVTGEIRMTDDVTLYAMWGLDSNSDGKADADEVMITPADITIYTGGDSQASVVSDEDGNTVSVETQTGLPVPGFYITLPYAVDAALKASLSTTEAVDLSHYLTFTSGEKSWALELYNTKGNSAVNGRYIYRIVGEGQDPVRLEFTDQDGSIIVSDEFDISEALYQTYTMGIYPGAVTEGSVTANVVVEGEETARTASILLGTGRLTIRGVTGEEAISAIAEEAPAQLTGVTAVSGDAQPTYYINGSTIPVSSPENVQLLVDKLTGGETVESTLLEMAAGKLPESEEVNAEFRYLDLVDTGNGNVWVTMGAEDSLTIYWPYPDGTDRNTVFTLIHYKGLDREFAVDNLEEQSCTPEDVAVSYTDQGIQFTAGSFSPYALVWAKSAETGGNPVIIGGGTGSTVTSYPITVKESTNGEVQLSHQTAAKNTTVTITVTPGKGYELSTLTATDSKGNKLELTDKGEGKYTFTMPASKVEIQASFQEVPEQTVNPFADVAESTYYYDAVLWAVANDITNGTSAATFSPDATMTRAQMVTFLWRAHGAPNVTSTNPFTDVSADTYYYDAVLWAVANGVTTGTSATTFSPDAPVTRAQAVTFQWRAAGSPVVSGSSFDDVAADAYYVNAVTWAVANGITNGTGGNNFSPDAAVSRAQAVTFLWRELA